MSQTPQWLTQDRLSFPPLGNALTDPDGLLAVGGDLSPQRIIKAYSLGIFPWFNDDQPILWWSPSSRAIIPTDKLKINRTLQKFLRKTDYRLSVNCAFDEVIQYCANAPFRSEDTWITDEMSAAYENLHRAGYAHSIEVWQEQTLIGGLYGIAIGGYFSGESMFYKKDNASKLALIAITSLLTSAGIHFIDCQIENPFLNAMGCKVVSREQFITMKDHAMATTLPHSFWQSRFLDLSNLMDNM